MIKLKINNWVKVSFFVSNIFCNILLYPYPLLFREIDNKINVNDKSKSTTVMPSDTGAPDCPFNTTAIMPHHCGGRGAAGGTCPATNVMG